MASNTSKPAKSLALVAQPNGSALVRIATKTSTGTRLLTKWEFRKQNNLSRSETEKQWAEYVKQNAAQFNAQTAALIASGKMHVTSFAATAAGSITIKARKELPTPEEIKPTKKEERVMNQDAAMKALGITPEMLAALKAMGAQTSANTNTPASETKEETPAGNVEPAKGIDQLLAEAAMDATK